MSDLTGPEKLKLERTLVMGDGFVLGFSNRSFREFFVNFFGIDICDAKYAYETGSKANRMRAFWNPESNYLVGQMLAALFDNWQGFKTFDAPETVPDECVNIAHRLLESAPPPDLAVLVPLDNVQAFDSLARSVRQSIERNEPEAGLDRLHTFVVMYFRTLCEKRGIDAGRDKPLHGIVGEYVKALRSAGEIESEMTARILKSSISVMESFNQVRNERSLAHANEMLGRDEATLISSHVTSLVRFVATIEARAAQPAAPTSDYDDIPF